ncbi:hypothetical protein Hdeb2414_s0433g00892661 [Helianthus debilis subsp. tardiflorus]
MVNSESLQKPKNKFHYVKQVLNCSIYVFRHLPFHRRHLIGASIQLQKATKILDFGVVRAMRFLYLKFRSLARYGILYLLNHARTQS